MPWAVEERGDDTPVCGWLLLLASPCINSSLLETLLLLLLLPGV